MERTIVSEAVFEKMLDLRVQRALMRDSRYRNAENAMEQADAEATIERECEDALAEKYEVA